MKISIYDLQGQKVETYSVLLYFLSYLSCSCVKPADKEVGVCNVTPEGLEFSLPTDPKTLSFAQFFQLSV